MRWGKRAEPSRSEQRLVAAAEKRWRAPAKLATLILVRGTAVPVWLLPRAGLNTRENALEKMKQIPWIAAHLPEVMKFMEHHVESTFRCLDTTSLLVDQQAEMFIGAVFADHSAGKPVCPADLANVVCGYAVWLHANRFSGDRPRRTADLSAKARTELRQIWSRFLAGQTSSIPHQ